MESFERRDFVIWRGVGGDTAQAPLAFHDAVQSVKDQVQTIAMDRLVSGSSIRHAWTSFPHQRRQNPRTMRDIVAVVFS